MSTHAYSNPSVGVWNIVSTLVGIGTAGYAEGTGASAQFNSPDGIAVDSSGNIYVADAANNRVRKITPTGTTSLLAGRGTAGYAEGTGASAQFLNPEGIAVDSSGTVYVADAWNYCIRKITPGGTTSLLAGNGGHNYVEGTGNGAQFNIVTGLTVDSSGTVYVADNGNQRIRKITSGGTTSLLAGNSTASYADGTGASAAFHSPADVAVDS